MNWQKISEESSRAFREFHHEGNFKCTEDDFVLIIHEHGESIMGIFMEDLYHFFDEREIYVQIRNISSSQNKVLNTFQWKINNSGWSTESFMCRKAAESKAFEVAFDEREKQWNKLI